LNKSHYDLSDSDLEDEFKILFEELKLKNEKNLGKDKNEEVIENYRKNLGNEEKFVIKRSIQESENYYQHDFHKVDSKKNLKKELKMLIDNIDEELVENDILNLVGASDLEFYDI
jgi:hypothetical protein